MDWPNERYVRLYSRDTLDWQALSFEAQGLWALLLRKFDRAGLIDLGRHGLRGLALAVGHGSRWDVLKPAVDELLHDGCLVVRGKWAISRNYIPAQEAESSNTARSRAHRERIADQAMAARVVETEVLEIAGLIEESALHHALREGGGDATPSLAVPCLAVPSVPEKKGSDAQSATPRPEAGAVTVLDRRKRQRPAKTPDPLHRPLQQALAAEYRKQFGEEYGFNGKDAKHLSSLLEFSRDLDVHVRKYRNLLGKGKAGLGLFVSAWNDKDVTSGPAPPSRDISRGYVPPNTNLTDEDYRRDFEAANLRGSRG